MTHLLHVRNMTNHLVPKKMLFRRRERKNQDSVKNEAQAINVPTLFFNNASLVSYELMVPEETEVPE